MKKEYSFIFLTLILPAFINAQNIDTIKVKLEIDSLIKVSLTLNDKREFEKALEVNEISEKLAIEKFGKESPLYGSTCSNHGRIMWCKSDFPEAEKWFLKYKAISEKVLGKEHADYVKAITWLAILYEGIGNYEKAEQLYLESKAISEKISGNESPYYIRSLINLADLSFELGNYEKAERLYLESKAILEKVSGKEDPGYVTALSNLANLYIEMGNYEKAEPLCLEFKAIMEKVQGKEHPNYALSLINLANLYTEIGNYEKAEPLCLESKAILEKVLGKEDPDFAESLISLANLYSKMGNYEKAEPLFLKIKAIREKVFGKEGPDYAMRLNNLATLYSDLGNYEKAEPLFIELSNLYQTLISRSIHYLSEHELNLYLNKFSVQLESLLSFTHNSKSEKITQSSYDNCLFYKGFLLNYANQIKRLAYSDSVNTEKFNLLKSYERLLAKEFTKPIVDRKGVEDLETKTNELEKDLARTVPGYNKMMQQVNWLELQKKLKADEAAIEFVHFNYTNPKPTDSILYSALLLIPSDSSPQYITLFEEKELNKLLPSSSTKRTEYVANLYHAPSSNTGKNNTLYDLIWKPLESKLKGVKTIYFSPSGLLHQINLNVISINDKNLLSDKYNLIQLGSTRQLVIKDTNNTNKPISACLIGGVNFDMDTSEIMTKKQVADTNSLALRSELNFSYTDSTLRGGSFKYLAGSEKEIKQIQQIFSKANIKATSYQGNGATEEAFKKLGDYNSTSPQIIHISTHGYFFPDPKEKVGSSQFSVGSEPVFKISEHPMIRSGLLLAGANQTWKTRKPLRPDMEDGILTAYEISQLNLRNTELVVLSACETGLGDIQGNEGVYGLQRAFKIAGVKNLIMSLWQVPDKETSELMTFFYQNWLLKKMSIRESLLAAQNVLRKRGLAAFYWAGFVLVE